MTNETSDHVTKDWLQSPAAWDTPYHNGYGLESPLTKGRSVSRTGQETTYTWTIYWSVQEKTRPIAR